MPSGAESARVRNPSLHELLEAFTVDAAAALAGATAGGDEIPFEVVESDPGKPRRGVPLYCYRPLTGAFIDERIGMLSALSSYAPAVRAVGSLDGADAYISHRGGSRASRERADEVLRCLLARVFEDRSEFTFDADRFEVAYGELERMLYCGRCVAIVLAPVLGVSLQAGTAAIDLGDGLTLVRGDDFSDAPIEAVWGEGADQPHDDPQALAVLRVTQERSDGPPVSDARRRFRRLLTALRLLERGGYALGPLAWARVDDGPWNAHALGHTGRHRLAVGLEAGDGPDLRSLYGQVSRRAPSPTAGSGRGGEVPVPDASGNGELTWALSRFEMGCERLAPFEALTDYLLALRALLEPEGPSSGRLAGRLAAICAPEEERAALAERTAHAISLERAVIAGLAPARAGVDALVEEMADHLRAILRDVLCGHLDVDVRAIADQLLARTVAVVG